MERLEPTETLSLDFDTVNTALLQSSCVVYVQEELYLIHKTLLDDKSLMSFAYYIY